MRLILGCASQRLTEIQHLSVAQVRALTRGIADETHFRNTRHLQHLFHSSSDIESRIIDRELLMTRRDGRRETVVQSEDVVLVLEQVIDEILGDQLSAVDLQYGR